MDRFVDRDMFMRYLGGGVGHLALREHVKIEEAAKAIGVNLKSTPTPATDSARGESMSMSIQQRNTTYIPSVQEPFRSEAASEGSDEDNEDEIGNTDDILNFDDSDHSDSEMLDEYQDEEDNIDEIADYGYLFGHGGNTMEGAESDEDEEDAEGRNMTQAVDAAEDSTNEDALSDSNSNFEAEDEYGEYGFGSY